MTDERRESIIERVEWHEGMLLSPQHFQLLDARVDQLMRWHRLHASPFAWGVWSCRFEPMSLALGRIQVLALEAVMSDGTVVHYDVADPLQAPLELDLQRHAALLNGDAVDVYLTLPGAHTLQISPADDNADADADAKVARRRFRSVAGPLVPDTVSGGEAVAVPRRVPHLRLAAGDVPDARYDVMRIATLRRSADVVMLDDRLPPSLRLADQGSIMARLSDIAVRMRAKAVFLARQRAQPGLAARDGLRCLTLALPQVEAMRQTPDLHPHTLFGALAAIRGALALLLEDTVPALLDRYDHDDPGKSVMPLIADIEQAMQAVSVRYRERTFTLRDGIYEAVLEEDLGDSCLVVAIGGTLQGLTAWMANAVIGSKADLPTLRARRVLGLPREAIDDASTRIGGDSATRAVFRIDTRHAYLQAGTVLALYRPPTPGQPVYEPTFVLLEALPIQGDGRDSNSMEAVTC